MTAPFPHDPGSCEGRGCSRHHPSDHHMRGWPKAWSTHRGYHLRHCPHGVGHPDPDDIVALQSVGGASAAHPCDGCCIAPLREEP